MNITVFCSSSEAAGPELRALARGLGELIARGGHTLVYGGATGGLMDEVAAGAARHDGQIIGIIPDCIAEAGRTSTLPTQLFRVETLAERKAMMMEYADLFVALPGGFGTLDEMMSSISAAKVGETEARTVIVNYDGFYDCLLGQIEHFTAAGLGKENDRRCYATARSLSEIADLIDNVE